MSAAAGGAQAIPGSPERPILLVNPLSFRASWFGMASRARRLARDAGIESVVVTDPATLRAVLDALRARGQRELWVLSGDGTIHALVDYLARVPEGEWSPVLLLLAGGRANVVPRECGGYPAMPALRRALAVRKAGRPLAEETLFALKVSQPDTPTRFGFLLAGAMIHEGVRLCAEYRAGGNSWFRRSWLADPWTLLKLGFLALIGRSQLPPYPEMTLRIDEGRNFSAPLRVLVASTLRLDNALYNPFAARGEGRVRVTAVAAGAAKFWRSLPRLIGGRFDATMDEEHGYMSGRCAGVDVLGIGGYALDGESFGTDPGWPLRIEPGIALRVLRP